MGLRCKLSESCICLCWASSQSDIPQKQKNKMSDHMYNTVFGELQKYWHMPTNFCLENRPNCQNVHFTVITKQAIATSNKQQLNVQADLRTSKCAGAMAAAVHIDRAALNDSQFAVT